MNYQKVLCKYEKGCDLIYWSRGLCRKHYALMRKQGTLEEYSKVIIKGRSKNRLCTIENCTQKHYGKGFCQFHYKESIKQDNKDYFREWNLKTKVNPIRIEQKRQAQETYSRTTKAIFSLLQRVVKKRKKITDITFEQLDIFKHQPCCECGMQLTKTTGLGINLINPRKQYTIDNIKRICKNCNLRKPIDKFDHISYSKKQLRRGWKRNPNALLAFQLARTEKGITCNICKNSFSQKQIELDHIEPISNVNEDVDKDLNNYASKLYCSYSNLQCVCKKCHKEKTAKENKERWANRNAKKKKAKEQV